MRMRARGAALVLGLALLGPGPAFAAETAPAAETAATGLARGDQLTVWELRSRYRDDSELDTVGVEVKGGLAILRGWVGDEEDRDRAGQIALEHPRIETVENDLLLERP